MFCPNCGNQIADGSAFCPACGKATNVIVQATPVQPVQYGYVKPKVPGRGLGIAGMVLGIIGLVYCFAALSLAANFAENTTFYGNIPSIVFSPFIVYSVFPILAVSLAGAGRYKGYKTGVSASGVIMGIIGLALLTIALIVIAVNA
ncbi:MAG: zinc-ribbon domain-containing protein [Clostridia bacterium]|nr:zinc-ribbon domain-containing protein [Clostridia bacterium]